MKFIFNQIFSLDCKLEGPPSIFLVYLDLNHSGKYQDFEIQLGGHVMVYGRTYRPMALVVTGPKKKSYGITYYRHMVFVNRDDKEWIYINDDTQIMEPILDEPNVPTYVVYSLSTDIDKA